MIYETPVLYTLPTSVHLNFLSYIVAIQVKLTTVNLACDLYHFSLVTLELTLLQLSIMKKNLIIKNLLFGFLSWLIPFAVSFLFYKPDGELVVPYATFKSVIMVVGTTSGCYLLYRYFSLLDKDFVRNGWIAGLSWMVINLLLDAIILIPMMKSNFADYFMSIGISYLAIPAIGVAMGYLLKEKAKTK